jgi:hypothetical protein
LPELSEGLKTALEKCEKETFMGQHLQIPGFYAKHLFGVKNKNNNKIGKLISHQMSKQLLILKFEQLTIIGAYFNPEISKIEICESLFECLFESLETLENVILDGDFNCRLDNGS